jgi:hypothetical protein
MRGSGEAEMRGSGDATTNKLRAAFCLYRISAYPLERFTA